MIGDENDIQFLIWYYNFLTSAPENIGAQTARTNVPFAIGLLSGRFNSMEGVSFLASLAVPPSAMEAGEGSFVGLDKTAALQVGKNALVGLALSPVGDPDDYPADGQPLGARVEAFDLPPDFTNVIEDIAIESRAQGIEQYFGNTNTQ